MIRHRTTAALVALLTAGALTACTPDTTPPTTTPTSTTTPSQTPTPSPTPTVDPAEAAKQANIDAAIAAYEAHIDAVNRVGQAGMVGWETDVLPAIGSSDLREEIVSLYTQLSEQGVRQTGEREIASLTVTDYVEDPTGAGHEQVRLDVCLDNSGVDEVDAQGKSILLAGYPPRLITSVLMQRQVDFWTISEMVTQEGQQC
ncbi:hypothetical protein [uncultured Cellulomonas sp.]|uniref:hypothetical protein n=1 Tax=uncultured Cellulomonas sp. TaxID=189682 RepID=UPI00262BA869|nr:hypothetical protein [uncultured Cellulomonas sp.]